MRVLSIGNSFSQDAHAWLHQLAAGAGLELETVNLYIGGCPLETHAANLRSGEALYRLEINGRDTGRDVSLPWALEQGSWDAVTFQQASHDSGLAETYEPHLGFLVSETRRLCPEAELFLHQTWAYETDSTHEAFSRYGRSQARMQAALEACYQAAAARHSLQLIPAGEVIRRLRETQPFRYAEGGRSLCRDGFHLDLLYGRYAAACAWLTCLTGVPAAVSSFIPSIETEETDLGILKQVQTLSDAICLQK